MAQHTHTFTSPSNQNPFVAANALQFEPSNPFARAAAARPNALAVAEDAAPGTYTYAMVKSGPDVLSSDVELDHTDAVEVTVLWGDSVMHVSHLTPMRAFHVGEEQRKHLTTDCFVPAESIGTTRMPVVVCDGGVAYAVLPQGATGWVELPGEARVALSSVRDRAEACSELAGARRIPLPRGARARIEIGGFAFQVATVRAGKPCKRGLAGLVDQAMASTFGLTLLSAAAGMAAMAYFVPPLGLTDDENASRDQLYAMSQYLDAAAERERETQKEDTVTPSAAEQGGEQGAQAKATEGQMGKVTATATNKHYAVKKVDDNERLARPQQLEEASNFGLIGMLTSMNAGDKNAPTAPFGADTSSGRDDLSAQGSMWGDELGESRGMGGLGLSGLGSGGGGDGEGIGLGDIGGLGSGLHHGPGGFGLSSGLSSGTYTPKKRGGVRIGPTEVSGRLPREVIQRIVRQNYGRFRMCYENALMGNPNLSGRVTARFVIGRDGAVSNVSNGGSDLPDSKVVGCVVSAFYGLSFPQPENGIVTVVYPISFTPG